jgi:hypothetical protein
MSPREEAIAVLLLRRWLTFAREMQKPVQLEDLHTLEIMAKADELTDLCEKTEAFLDHQGAS